MKPHTDGRRLAAARALGGYGSHKALADALQLSNFGERTIREVESDRRALKPHEKQAVAELVGFSPALFEVDLRLIGFTDLRPDAQGLAQAALEAAQELLRAAAADRPSLDEPDHPDAGLGGGTR